MIDQFLGDNLGVPINVFGPETHMTAIVAMALGKIPIPPPVKKQSTTANFLLPNGAVGLFAFTIFQRVFCLSNEVISRMKIWLDHEVCQKVKVHPQMMVLLMVRV